MLQPINALQKKREHVLEQLQQLQGEAQVVISIMNNEEASKSLDGMRDSKSITHFLQNEYGVSTYVLITLNLPTLSRASSINSHYLSDCFCHKANL